MFSIVYIIGGIYIYVYFARERERERSFLYKYSNIVNVVYSRETIDVLF